MRRPLFATAVCAVLTASAALIASGSATADAYGGGRCLRFRDLQNLTKIDNRTLLATTHGSARYTVNLRHECPDFGRIGNFYKVRLHSEWECVDRDDVLEFRYGGACFIESVTPAPK